MEVGILLITFGVIFLMGLAADEVGRLAHVPRVTLLLLIGLAAGDAGLGLFDEQVTAWFETFAVVALTMVALLLGSSRSKENLAAHGRAIVLISIAVVLATLVVVTTGLVFAGLDLRIAVLLGAIATATDPAAIADVIWQSGAKSRFTQIIKGIVAIDDAWGLVVFSLAFAVVGQSDGAADVLFGAATEVGGAILLGTAIGLPASYLTGRISSGEPLQAEAIGIVF